MRETGRDEDRHFRFQPHLLLLSGDDSAFAGEYVDDLLLRVMRVDRGQCLARKLG